MAKPTSIFQVRLLILFIVIWGILWLYRPHFVYKYNPRTGVKTYDYSALFAGTLILTIICGGVLYFFG